MKTQTRMRLGMMLLILALVVGITGYADRDAEAYCYSGYYACEYCMYIEESCGAGTLHPECGGNALCCYGKAESCYRCCIWY